MALVDHEVITLARAYGRYDGLPTRQALVDAARLYAALVSPSMQ